MDTLVKVRDLHKVYYRGSEQIDVLQGVTLDIPHGRFPGADGTVGLGQDDAAQPDRRARYADQGLDRSGRRSHRHALGRAARGVAGAAHRVRLPDVQPAAGADRGAQRRAAAAADQARRRPIARSACRRRSRSSASASAPTTTRASSRAVRNSASASPGRSSPTRRCCSATSRPATSIASPATKCSTCCRRSTATTTRRSSWSRTTRTPPSCARRTLHLEKGLLVEETVNA